ncbi:MAG: hypothetical protein IH897_00495, partial [Planctomycetes bacterium]|nr:hypothetical protein [Planctomycetota bacterium]
FSRGLRGGSWVDGENILRSSNQFDVDPPFEISVIGFRVASSFFPRPGDLDDDDDVDLMDFGLFQDLFTGPQ